MEVVKQSINLGDMSIDVENIKSTLWEARGTFEELRDIALSSVGYLERISKHTFELYDAHYLASLPGVTLHNTCTLTFSSSCNLC